MDSALQSARAFADVDKVDARPDRHPAFFSEPRIFQLQQHADAWPVVLACIFLQQANRFFKQAKYQQRVAPGWCNKAAVEVNGLADLGRIYRLGGAYGSDFTVAIGGKHDYLANALTCLLFGRQGFFPEPEGNNLINLLR